MDLMGETGFKYFISTQREPSSKQFKPCTLVQMESRDDKINHTYSKSIYVPY